LKKAGVEKKINDSAFEIAKKSSKIGTGIKVF